MTGKKTNEGGAMAIASGKAVSQITPMTLIQQAQASGSSTIEQMQQLFDLQLRWEQNEARKAYNLAVAAFKAEAISITKDKRVGFDQRGGDRTEYKHATLGNIVNILVPCLSRHGLSHRWNIHQNGEVTVTCVLSHEGGHSEEVSMSAGKDDSGKKNQIQQIASTVTYLQRYTLLAITGCAAADQDDDGRSSQAEDAIELINDNQYADLLALIEETGTVQAQFCAAYRIQNLEDLPASLYNHACKALEKKRSA